MLSRALARRPAITITIGTHVNQTRRLAQMASHLTNGAGMNGIAATDGEASSSSSSSGYTLKDLPKSNVFTTHLPPDPAFPTPSKSHSAPRETLGPRLVKGALYTYVRPEPTLSPELLAVSPRALQDLDIAASEAQTEEFKQLVAGNLLLTYDEALPDADKGIYPWAQCYGGYQFGQWAGQLGDGRAISLFETTNRQGTRYELQLKGAGRTPYSRFADGKAVLRSSIREFVVSEHLNALGIPSTRALSLVLCPRARVQRERIEPGAIVCRFAQSWLRIGTFDLLRARGDRKLIRQLATYVAEHVFGGWETLPAKLPPADVAAAGLDVERGVASHGVQGEGKEAENRFTRLYREVVRRNAKTVAYWQAYAFTNGVLNTDNTSIFGLSIDFGPFAFVDKFDPTFTPNHDDHMLRYSYRNQPTIIWWNLVRLGEALGELIGAGAKVDEEEFVEQGVRKDFAPELIERAETIIGKVGEEYKAVFMGEYRRLMAARLGLKQCKEEDAEGLVEELLDIMQVHELDFNQVFRRLSGFTMQETESEEGRREVAGRLFHKEDGVSGSEESARERIGKWLQRWRTRVIEDWGEGQDEERTKAMKAVNPKFVAKAWILDELIERVEKKGEREILQNIMKMALNPFEEEWGWDREEEERFCGDVPAFKSGMQCSCSS